MDPGSDETVRLPRPSVAGPARARIPIVWMGAGSVLLLAACGTTWFLLRSPAPPAPAPPPAVTAAPKPAPMPPMATEAAILDAAPAATEISRFAAQPNILIVQFASLADQAAALNRVAGLLEKSGFPRDQVLDPMELDRRIRASGATPENFYFGHDYRAADLLRFYAKARAEGVALTPPEAALQTALGDLGWQPGTNAALISLARQDDAQGNDAQARKTILRHELSHGLYFTSPEYAAFVARFWNETLTESERSRFRAFLANEGYDTAQEDLMINEMQAYLMHTRDTRYFNADAVGMTPDRLQTLRILFLEGMPPSWLKDVTTAP